MCSASCAAPRIGQVPSSRSATRARRLSGGLTARPNAYASTRPMSKPSQARTRPLMKRRTVIRLVLTLTVTGPGARLHLLEDRRRQDAAHPCQRQSLVLRAVGRDRVPHRPADGLALEAAAEGEGHPGQRRLADPRVLRLLLRQPDAPDLGRRRRRPHLRDGETAPGQGRAGRGVDHPGAGARRSGDADPGRDRDRARVRELRHRHLPVGRGRVRRADGDRRESSSSPSARGRSCAGSSRS